MRTPALIKSTKKLPGIIKPAILSDYNTIEAETAFSHGTSSFTLSKHLVQAISAYT
jgi:hypothetical protein